MKNVTGYDMCKLQAGAYGTLSVLAEVTLKVMPKPETACTILLQSMADEIAIPELSQALNTPYEVSAAAHLPASVARRSGVAAVAEGLLGGRFGATDPKTPGLNSEPRLAGGRRMDAGRSRLGPSLLLSDAEHLTNRPDEIAQAQRMARDWKPK